MSTEGWQRATSERKRGERKRSLTSDGAGADGAPPLLPESCDGRPSDMLDAINAGSDDETAARALVAAGLSSSGSRARFDTAGGAASSCLSDKPGGAACAWAIALPASPGGASGAASEAAGGRCHTSGAGQGRTIAKG